jgi:hypothetical protein
VHVPASTLGLKPEGGLRAASKAPPTPNAAKGGLRAASKAPPTSNAAKPARARAYRHVNTMKQTRGEHTAELFTASKAPPPPNAAEPARACGCRHISFKNTTRDKSMQLMLTCVSAQCAVPTTLKALFPLTTTSTPCRDVSQRVIRGDRRRCGVSESSANLALAADTFVDVMRPDYGTTAYTNRRVNICPRWDIPR